MLKLTSSNLSENPQGAPSMESISVCEPYVLFNSTIKEDNNHLDIGILKNSLNFDDESSGDN